MSAWRGEYGYLASMAAFLALMDGGFVLYKRWQDRKRGSPDERQTDSD